MIVTIADLAALSQITPTKVYLNQAAVDADSDDKPTWLANVHYDMRFRKWHSSSQLLVNKSMETLPPDQQLYITAVKDAVFNDHDQLFVWVKAYPATYLAVTA